MCEICAKVFKKQRSYELHFMVEHTNSVQKVQCELCGIWLKHEEMLRQHKMRHRETVQTCPICGRQSKNRKSLASHLKRVHTEALFKCNVCEKSFKRQLALKVTENNGYIE